MSIAECKESEHSLQLRIVQGFLQQLQRSYEEKTVDTLVDVEQPLEMDQTWIKKLVVRNGIIFYNARD
jgi:hypothetical protein